MVANLQAFKGVKSFAQSQENTPEFNIGGDDAILQWYANQPVRGKGTVPATGWYVEQGKHPDLEAAIAAYNADHPDTPFRFVTIMHEQSKQDSEDCVFPEGMSFFVLCKGIKEPWIDRGIVNCYALAWGQKPGGKTESRFYVRAIIADLLAYGYDKPVQLQASKKGRTKGLIRTLTDQQRVLAEFKKKYDIALPYWHFSLPIGADTMDVGNAENSKEMYVPTSLIPSKITDEYLEAHYVDNYGYKPEEGEDALSQMLAATFKESIEWARDTTKALLRGKAQPENAPASSEDESDEAPVFDEHGNELPEELKKSRPPYPDDGEPATDEQRDGLEKLAVRKGQVKPDGIMRKDGSVTRGMIRDVIWAWNRLPNVKLN